MLTNILQAHFRIHSDEAGEEKVDPVQLRGVVALPGAPPGPAALTADEMRAALRDAWRRSRSKP